MFFSHCVGPLESYGTMRNDVPMLKDATHYLNLWKNGGIAPRIFNLAAGESSAAHNNRFPTTEIAPEPVWTFWEREKSAPAGNRSPILHSLSP